MKKLILGLFLVLAVNAINAQDVRRTFGVGLQSSFPTYGISVKYAVTEKSMVQATIAPFGVSSDGGSVSVNFYGLRYVHRFPDTDEKNISIDPYLFAGGGLLNYKADFSSFGGGSIRENAFGYSVGGGVETILGGKFGLSTEIGYGKMNFTGGIAATGIIFGAGLHFYIN